MMVFPYGRRVTNGQASPPFPQAGESTRKNFMKNAEPISELKLRAGYGDYRAGRTVLGTTPWQVSVASNSAQYPFNNNLTGGPASSIQGLGNTDLDWEKTNMFNIGLDLGISEK